MNGGCDAETQRTESFLLDDRSQIELQLKCITTTDSQKLHAIFLLHV